MITQVHWQHSPSLVQDQPQQLLRWVHEQLHNFSQAMTVYFMMSEISATGQQNIITRILPKTSQQSLFAQWKKLASQKMALLNELPLLVEVDEAAGFDGGWYRGLYGAGVPLFIAAANRRPSPAG